MAVDETARHQLYNSLESNLGPEPASTLMSLLPPVGWADVATRQDMHALENGLRGEIAELRGDTDRGLAELRGEMRQGFGDLRAELHQEISGLRTELHTSMHTAVFSMIGAMFTLAGLTWAATAVT